jgi:hypothetical protein
MMVCVAGCRDLVLPRNLAKQHEAVGPHTIQLLHVVKSDVRGRHTVGDGSMQLAAE